MSDDTRSILDQADAEYSASDESWLSPKLELGPALIVWSAAAHAGGRAFVPRHLSSIVESCGLLTAGCNYTADTQRDILRELVRLAIESATIQHRFIGGWYGRDYSPEPREPVFRHGGGLLWDTSVRVELRPSLDHWLVEIYGRHLLRWEAADYALTNCRAFHSSSISTTNPNSLHALVYSK